MRRQLRRDPSLIRDSLSGRRTERIAAVICGAGTSSPPISMPELPEVETIVRGLRGTILGRSITAVRLGKTDFIDDPIALAEKLPGTRITAIERYGKFIALTLEPLKIDGSAFQFFVHLGMTGQLIPRGA